MLEVEGDVYLSSGEACELLGVKPATLYAYVSRDLLRSYRQGIRRQRLYRLEDVQRLLRVQPTADGLVELPRAESWMDDK